jgi:hypothetical protein
VHVYSMKSGTTVKALEIVRSPKSSPQSEK